jgi:hypothetical protein
MYAEGHGKDIGAYRECWSGEERIRGAICRPRSPFLLFSCTSILVYEIHTGARAQPERMKKWCQSLLQTLILVSTLFIVPQLALIRARTCTARTCADSRPAL